MKKCIHIFSGQQYHNLIVLFAFILVSVHVKAGEVIQSNYRDKSTIVNNSTISVNDNLYADELLHPTWYAATRKHQVRLIYHRESRTDVASALPWTYQIIYKIYPTSTPPPAQTYTLTVSHSAGGPQDNIYEAVMEHALNYPDVTIKVFGAPVITGPGVPPSDIRLELSTITERYIDLGLSSAPSPLIYYNSVNSELSWGFISGAEEYDVEWTFIDAKDTPPVFVNPEDPFNYKSPVRITTGNQYYPVDQVYPKGKIYFRVRGVGRHISGVGTDYTHLSYTGWGYKGSYASGIPPLSFAINTSFENNKNWSYTAAFAEQGKVKKGIGYSDGGGKSRQSIATMNSDNTVIVGENKYDLEGRPVIAIMPTPVEVSTPLTTALAYKGLFNKDANNGEYTNLDFQLGSNPLGNSSGAGQYYSSLNPFTADPFAKYTDDAGGSATSSTTDGGFPFTQVQYCRDNTGRVSKTTGGAGTNFVLGQGHELSYYYGSANSTELHRMFGTNVGIANHYKKNLAIDANGQMSLSYYDQEERVVATCLTGASPDNLTALDENLVTPMTVSLNENNTVSQSQQESVNISNILNVLPNTIHTFSYDMKGVIYGYNEEITGVTLLNHNSPPTAVLPPCTQNQTIPLCGDCKYKLEISVTDPDGLTVMIPDPLAQISPVNMFKREFSNPNNPDCPNNQYDVNGVTFALTFTKIGNYSVSKKLTLDTTGIYIKIHEALIASGLGENYQNTLINCYINNTDFSVCDISCEQHCRTQVLQAHTDWAANQANYVDQIDAAVAECQALNCNLPTYCEQTCSTQVFAANPTWDASSPGWDNINHSAEITAAVNECVANQCGGTSCNVMMDQMLVDVSPGGALFAPTAAEPGDEPNAPCSPNLFWTKVEAKMNAYTSSAEPTAEQLANPDYIILLDVNNQAMSPQPDVSYLQYPANWSKPNANPEQWAAQLVKASNNYCHYQSCVAGETSVVYDVKMAAAADWNVANTLGYTDPLGMGRTSSIYSLPSGVSITTVTAGIDPLFAIQDITAGSLYSSLAEALSTNFPFNSHNDIWHYVNDPTNPAYVSGGLPYTDVNRWLVFRGLYLDKKTFIYNNWNRVNCPSCPPAPTINTSTTTIQNAYDMANDCGEIAALNAIYWMDQLQHFADSSGCGTLSAADKIAIKHNLMLYCQANCGLTNPMGYIVATAINANPSTHIANPSDVYLMAVQNILSSAGCSTALYYLSAGDPYTITCPTSGVTVDATLVTDCFKQLVQYMDVVILPASAPVCYQLNNNSSYPLLQAGCMNYSYLHVLGGSDFQLSNSSSCSQPSGCENHLFHFYRADGTAINSADMLSMALPVHVASSPVTGLPAGETFKNVQCVVNSNKVIATNPIVNEGPVLAYLYEVAASPFCTWTSISPQQQQVTSTCTATLNSTSYNDVPTFDELQAACILNLLSQDTIAGIQAYNNMVTSFTEQYLQAHFSNCFSNHLQEDFNYLYLSNEYHYTLYYYDQAGNLTQTVPPKGVHLVPLIAFTNGVYAGSPEPQHTYRTRYTYNSLNQVATQQTPDGGLTHYFYDDAGRLRFSQNAKQLVNNAYSYTIYDGLSRIKEVGESSQNYTGSTPFYNGVNDLTFPDNNRTQVTYTLYDVGLSGAASTRFENGQQFLRTRVSGTFFFEGAFAGISQAPTASTFYSYDQHGNVNELVQDNNLLASLGTDIEYKYMRYKYQLVSGNVKEVAYQPGRPDQFYHKYIYDADNRLTIAMTSNHAPLSISFDQGWEKDAKYFYYKHGPLARTETGEDKVQGTDYAYTINGWLKGINATTLNTSRDMAKDGNLSGTAMDVTNNNNLTGVDALGYTLGYFDTDYNAIGGSTAQAWQATTAGTNLFNGAYRNLYNGNIALTTSAFMDNSENKVSTMAKAYQYDQLNRLKSASAFSDLSTNLELNNTFASAADNGYNKELFSYDPNGNISKVRRWGASSKMDNFTYNYQDATAGYSDNTNKLRYVADDAVLTGNYNDDIDDQSASYGTIGNENYNYDAIGNLTGDKTEGIKAIEWNVYGKVISVNRIPGFYKVINGVNTYPVDLEFKYDASGNRICKIVKPRIATGQQTEEHWIYTYYTRDAQGNVMAIYNRAVILSSGTVTDKMFIKEHDIYGSSRIGIETKNVSLGGAAFNFTNYNTNNTDDIEDGSFTRPTTGITMIRADLITNPQRLVGDKNYELVNHLGNVMVTVSDKKFGMDVDNFTSYFYGKQAEQYSPDVISSQDYFAYNGMMDGRKFNETAYRYGAGTQEKDDEIYGSGNSYTAEYWQYDPRLGRRWNIDPISYAWQSTYATFNNNPIYFSDPTGLEGNGGDDKKTGGDGTRNPDSSTPTESFYKRGDGVKADYNSRVGRTRILPVGQSTRKWEDDYLDLVKTGLGQHGLIVSAETKSWASNGMGLSIKTNELKPLGDGSFELVTEYYSFYPKDDWEQLCDDVADYINGEANNIKEYGAIYLVTGIEANAEKALLSVVKQDAKLLKLAEETFEGNKILRTEANALMDQLAKGNMNPGIGSKNIGKGIFEARSRGGARVYFKNVGKKIIIVGYSNKSNQQQVINRLLEIHK